MSLPQTPAKRRAPRMHFADLTPAVLRLQNGWRVPGNLQVVSVTGGLLCLDKPLSQGCEVKLMFVTDAGPVLGTAEMLRPAPGGQQAFRFTTLSENDQSKLRTVIQSSMARNYLTH